ncbi:hypothetical protein StrepF001_13325 [Streptomyces sp. F001]|nr:hypothetical protein StrepF001_13325 [Streptomyces sp. F001]
MKTRWSALVCSVVMFAGRTLSGSLGLSSPGTSSRSWSVYAARPAGIISRTWAGSAAAGGGAPCRVEDGLFGEEGLVDDQHIALRQARPRCRLLEVAVSRDDDLPLLVGLPEPAAHLGLQVAQRSVASQAAVEGDRRGGADLRVGLAALLAVQDVLGGQDQGGGDAESEQQRGDPHGVRADHRGPCGQFALQGAQDAGLEHQVQHAGLRARAIRPRRRHSPG